MKNYLLITLCVLLAACSDTPTQPQNAASEPTPEAPPVETTVAEPTIEEAVSEPEAPEPVEVVEEVPAQIKEVAGDYKPAPASKPKKSAKPTLPSRVDRGDYYVWEYGSDNNPGTAAKPFRTIQKAAEMAQPGQTVVVFEGTYREMVRPPRSGNPGSPITFKSNANDTVVISGTDVIEGWKSAGNGKFAARWKESFESKNNLAMQVFVNGRMMNEARFPNMNVGWEIMRQPRVFIDQVVSKKVLEQVTDRNVTARITVKASGFTEPAGKWDGARISIRPMWQWGWGMPRTGTVVSSKPGEITFDIINYEMGDPSNGSATIIRDNNPEGRNTPFFVFRDEDGVDYPGEWFYNEKTKQMTMIPEEGIDLNDALVEVKMRDWAFDLSKRNNINIEGFHIFGASITTDTESGTGIAEFEPYAQIRKMTVADANNITIDGIHARYVTHFTNLDGYLLSQWSNNSGIVISGRNITLKNSTIGYSAGNGVTMLGSGNTVTNNIVFNAGYSGAETGTVGFGCFATKCEDMELSYNTLYTAAGNNVHVGKLTSSDDNNRASIKHNIIHDSGTMRDDVGHVYSSGERDKSWVNLNNNVMSGITSFQGFGIYHDYSRYWHNFNNIVYDTSWATCMHTGEWGGGGEQNYFHNILWSIGHSVHGNAHGPGAGILFRNNIMHGDINKASPQSDYENNFLTDYVYNSMRKHFKNPGEMDFSLISTDPEIVDAGVPITDFKKKFTEGGPDMGPLDRGQPMFRVGADIKPVVAAPTKLQYKKSDNGVMLRWKDNASNEQFYILERSSKVDTNYMFHVNWEVIAILPPNTNSYIDKDFSGGLTYYRVRAPESRMTNFARVE